MQIDFSDIDEVKHWVTVNDDVMGGLSKSRIETSLQATGIFRGQLSDENNGGFVSIRRRIENQSLKGCSGLLLRIKGDGRTYQFRVRTDTQSDGIAYRAHFATSDEKWLTIHLPFTIFCPSFRGRVLTDAPALRPEQVRQIGFLLADSQPGPFCLEIAWIKAFE